MKFEKEQEASDTQSTREQVIVTTSFSSTLYLKADTTNPQPLQSNLPALSIFSEPMLSKEEDGTMDISKGNITSSSTPTLMPIEKALPETTSLQSEHCLPKPNIDKPTCGNIRKHILGRLKINRTFAAVVRRDLRKRKKRSKVKNEHKELYLKFKEEFLISPISAFMINSKKSSHIKPPPENDILFEYSWDEALDKKETVEDGNRSPRTPKPNLESRGIIHERNEQTPYPRWMIHVPDYVYNSDDDLLENCSIPDSKNSLYI